RVLCPVLSLLFFFSCTGAHRALLPFPTRRSSDLYVTTGDERLAGAIEDVAARRLEGPSLPGQLLGFLGNRGSFGDLNEPQPQRQDPEHGQEQEAEHAEADTVFHRRPRTLPLTIRFRAGATTKLNTKFDKGTNTNLRASPVVTSPPWPKRVPTTRNNATPPSVSAPTHNATATGPRYTRWTVRTAMKPTTVHTAARSPSGVELSMSIVSPPRKANTSPASCLISVVANRMTRSKTRSRVTKLKRLNNVVWRT